MDNCRFDHLARVLSDARTRRGLLATLTTLPMLGGLLALAGTDNADAKDRRRRRKQRHKQRKGNRKRKHGCKPKGKGKVCAGKCGPVTSRQTCGKTVDCGSCDCTPACEACFTCQGAAGAPGTCVPQAAGAPCGAMTCESGTLQPPGSCDGSGVCQPADPVSCAPYTRCEGNACANSCAGDEDCVAGDICCDGACLDGQTDDANCGACGHACGAGQTCQGGVCGVECGSDFCPSASEICVEDACHACDVCAEASCLPTVQAAIDAATSGDTLYLCAGTYTRNGTGQVASIVNKDLTLIGAGAGEDGTILSGGNVSSTLFVVSVYQSTLELRNLTVTGSNGSPGLGTSYPATVTLTGVLVTGNSNPLQTAGGLFNNGQMVLNAGTTVTGNSAYNGGGINNNAADSILTLKAGSRVIDNTATSNASGIRNAGTVIAQPGSEVEGCLNVGIGAGCPA